MINRLTEEIRRKRAPVVVGLDPMLSYLPEYIKNESFAQYGETKSGAADAILRFNKCIIDAIYDLVPAVKPQSAMYELFGAEGMAAFEQTVAYARQKGLIVIGDIKRGDIGSTSAAYAEAHLGGVKVGDTFCRGFDEDFATVNPYLGTDGIEPFLEVCRRERKGIFILVKTSNPSGGEFQDLKTDGRALFEHVAERIAAWGSELAGERYSYVGAVAGATYPREGELLRRLMPRNLLLVPGYGAQGAKGKDLAQFFHPDGTGALINSSRGIIAAYKRDEYAHFGERNFADASRRAAIDMIEDIRRSVKCI